MAYVNVPKDLSKVKNKVAFNLTKRQLICLIPTVLIGMALYYSARQVMSVSNAATLMVLGMLPGFPVGSLRKGRDVFGAGSGTSDSSPIPASS